MPVIRVNNNRGDDKWLMPDGLPDNIEDMEFDFEGVVRLGVAMYKGAYDDLVGAYRCLKRRMWERYPEHYSKANIKRWILETEGWFYENPFPISIDPNFFMRKARVEVFGPKWKELPYFVERKCKKENTPD